MTDFKSLAASLTKPSCNSIEPLRGAITPDNHGFSMPSAGPVFPDDPVWHFDDVDTVMIDYISDAAKVAESLPADATTIPIPDLPGYSMMKVIWNNMRDSSMMDYYETLVCVPCLIDGQPIFYVPYIYVTNDSAMAAGREAAGFPKKIAEISIDRFGDRVDTYVQRGEREIDRMRISGTGRIGEKLFSTPVPAGQNVALPFPYNVTLPLPPNDTEALTSIPLPTLTWRFLRDVGFDKPAPVMSQLVAAMWLCDGTTYKLEDVSISLRSAKNDPMDMFPVLGLLGGTFMHSNIKLPLREMKIVRDHIKG